MRRFTGLFLVFLMVFSPMMVSAAQEVVNDVEIVVETSQEEDMRAVWIATIYNLDYPKEQNNEEAQKQEFLQMLDNYQKAGINTVVVQVRPKADALYKSEINPWSEVLTGTQGKAPTYDPMEFMIEEVHKREMEFHAWLNPYRVTTSGTTDVNKLSENHPARLNPDWVITYGNALYYNPEVEGVKQHLEDTVREIVQNYDVDAIHFDDYFYPGNYPLPEGEDKDGVVANNRRNHINEMVQRVSNVIKSINPEVEFGISPMSVWKNSKTDPTGSDTSGTEAYYYNFGDARTWIKNGWIDYIVPQIYSEIGNSRTDYETLVAWWANEVNGTNVKLYIGQAIYKDNIAKEIDKHLEINEKYEQVQGNFYYSSRFLLSNTQGWVDRVLEIYNKPKYKLVEVTADMLTMRNGAGVSNSPITWLTKGTRLAVLDDSQQWYQVKIAEKIGWVNSSYVKAVK